MASVSGSQGLIDRRTCADVLMDQPGQRQSATRSSSRLLSRRGRVNRRQLDALFEKRFHYRRRMPRPNARIVALGHHMKSRRQPQTHRGKCSHASRIAFVAEFPTTMEAARLHQCGIGILMVRRTWFARRTPATSPYRSSPEDCWILSSTSLQPADGHQLPRHSGDRPGRRRRRHKTPAKRGPLDRSSGPKRAILIRLHVASAFGVAASGGRRRVAGRDADDHHGRIRPLPSGRRWCSCRPKGGGRIRCWPAGQPVPMTATSYFRRRMITRERRHGENEESDRHVSGA